MATDYLLEEDLPCSSSYRKSARGLAAVVPEWSPGQAFFTVRACNIRSFEKEILAGGTEGLFIALERLRRDFYLRFVRCSTCLQRCDDIGVVSMLAGLAKLDTPRNLHLLCETVHISRLRIAIISFGGAPFPRLLQALCPFFFWNGTGRLEFSIDGGLYLTTSTAAELRDALAPLVDQGGREIHLQLGAPNSPQPFLRFSRPGDDWHDTRPLVPLGSVLYRSRRDHRWQERPFRTRSDAPVIGWEVTIEVHAPHPEPFVEEAAFLAGLVCNQNGPGVIYMVVGSCPDSPVAIIDTVARLVRALNAPSTRLPMGTVVRIPIPLREDIVGPQEDFTRSLRDLLQNIQADGSAKFRLFFYHDDDAWYDRPRLPPPTKAIDIITVESNRAAVAASKEQHPADFAVAMSDQWFADSRGLHVHTDGYDGKVMRDFLDVFLGKPTTVLDERLRFGGTAAPAEAGSPSLLEPSSPSPPPVRRLTRSMSKVALSATRPVWDEGSLRTA